MKIVALEEHFVTEEVERAGAAVEPRWRDDSTGFLKPGSDMAARLHDLTDERIRWMDASGIDVQILSLTTPGVQTLAPKHACDVARRTNDLIARTVRDRPDRFGGFATLPTPAPLAAALELERAVGLGLQGAMMFGRTRDRNADAAEFMPIYEAAASLGVPLYLHPQMPDRPVRSSYYSGLGDEVDFVLAMGGVGWHYETGVQLLRLVLSGVFDRLPDLQIITGHWGELVLFYLERITVLSPVAKLERPIIDYFRRNVSVTPSGIFSQRYLHWALETLGVDRILFSTDYPYVYAPDGGARAFLEQSILSSENKSKIAHGNWDRLCARRVKSVP